MTTPPFTDLFIINGKAFEVKQYINGLPLVDIKMGSDYEWFLICLKSRLEHPERYAETENVQETIAHICEWLQKNKPQNEDFTNEQALICQQIS